MICCNMFAIILPIGTLPDEIGGFSALTGMNFADSAQLGKKIGLISVS